MLLSPAFLACFHPRVSRLERELFIIRLIPAPCAYRYLCSTSLLIVRVKTHLPSEPTSLSAYTNRRRRSYTPRRGCMNSAQNLGRPSHYLQLALVGRRMDKGVILNCIPLLCRYTSKPSPSIKAGHARASGQSVF